MTNFCARQFGGKNFLTHNKANSEVVIELNGDVNPCCNRIGHRLEPRAILKGLNEEGAKWNGLCRSVYWLRGIFRDNIGGSVAEARRRTGSKLINILLSPSKDHTFYEIFRQTTCRTLTHKLS